MSSVPFTSQVGDSVPKVDGTVAVGEDLSFQRRWWRFESAIWWFFAAILVCDLLGLFGRGYLAKAAAATPDHALSLEYERIERAGTPSIMTLHFSPSAIHNGYITVFVGSTVVQELGAQRISPQPMQSALSEGGLTYTFPASGNTVAEIQLSPSFPGRHRFTMRLHNQEISRDVYVLP